MRLWLAATFAKQDKVSNQQEVLEFWKTFGTFGYLGDNTMIDTISKMALENFGKGKKEKDLKMWIFFKASADLTIGL